MTSVTDKNIEDLTGRELLSYIQREKRELEKSGVLKKQKPFPLIPDEIKPFQLPDNWEWVRLGDISRKVHYGYTASATDKDTGVKMLRITDIQDNKVDWSNVPYCEIDNGKLEATKLYPKDILFARTGGTVGKSFLVKQVEGVSVFASYLIRVRLMELMNEEFIKFFFDSPLYWKQIQSAATGTGQPNVNATSLSQLMIPIPSLREQAEIVIKLKNGSMLKENIKETVVQEKKELERYRQVILQEAMRGELVEQKSEEGTGQELLASIQLERQQEKKKKQVLLPIEGEKEPYELPECWTWSQFGNFTINRDGERIPLSQDVRTNMDKVYDYYGASGVIDKVNDYLFNEDLLLIGEDGANLVTRTKPIAFIAKGEYWVNNHAHVIGCYNEASLKYLCYYINAIDLKPFVTGTAQPKLNQANLNKIPVPIPPLKEQQRIVEKLDATMMICDRLEEELETTKIESEKWYRAVLQEAFQPEVE